MITIVPEIDEIVNFYSSAGQHPGVIARRAIRNMAGQRWLCTRSWHEAPLDAGLQAWQILEYSHHNGWGIIRSELHR